MSNNSLHQNTLDRVTYIGEKEGEVFQSKIEVNNPQLCVREKATEDKPKSTNFRHVY